MVASHLGSSDGGGFFCEFVGFFGEAVFAAEVGEFVVAFLLIYVGKPAYFAGAFGAGVDRAAVGFEEMVGAAHQALPFGAMPH